MIAASTEPAGAQLFIDAGYGRVTPAQILVDKPGTHTFLVRKQGYLEETATANLQPGQIFHFAPSLKALGSTDDIKVGGKFKKLFGGGETAGMGAVSIKTQPKGAQVAITTASWTNFTVDLISIRARTWWTSPGGYKRSIASSKCKRAQDCVDEIWSGSESQPIGAGQLALGISIWLWPDDGLAQH